MIKIYILISGWIFCVRISTRLSCLSVTLWGVYGVVVDVLQGCIPGLIYESSPDYLLAKLLVKVTSQAAPVDFFLPCCLFFVFLLKFTMSCYDGMWSLLYYTQCLVAEMAFDIQVGIMKWGYYKLLLTSSQIRETCEALRNENCQILSTLSRGFLLPPCLSHHQQVESTLFHIGY